MASNKQPMSALEAAIRLNNQDSNLDAETRKNNAEVSQKEQKIKSISEQYITEPKVMVMGAPMYAPYFGNRMTISLNGFPVYVPLDGGRYEIPDSYARVFNERIRSVNDMLATQKALSNVSRNVESFPGERDFIQKV